MRYSLILSLFIIGFAGCKTKGNVQNKPYPAAVAPVKIENTSVEKTYKMQGGDIVGVWVLDKMQVGTNEFSAQQIGKEISVQFLGNGTMIMKNGANATEFFTYTFNDNVITTLEGLTMKVSELTDKILKIAAEEQGEKTILIYKKKNK
jgi:hypothetical protein